MNYAYTSKATQLLRQLEPLTGVTPTGVELGKGAYGRVCEVHYLGALYAAKQIQLTLLHKVDPKCGAQMIEEFIMECSIHR